MSNGLIVYEGPSRLDGQPITLLVTGTKKPSTNIKTGPMLQAWILKQDKAPHEAVKDGSDRSICGNCSLRGAKCYVQTWREPGQVYRQYRSGKYEPDLNFLPDSPIRLGAYGDPAAISLNVLRPLIKEGHTAYTHQWKDAPDHKEICMASVETEEQFVEAKDLGWRTYRIVKDANSLKKSEIVCPNVTHGINCYQCKLCDGTNNKKDIVIFPHGVSKNAF